MASWSFYYKGYSATTIKVRSLKRAYENELRIYLRYDNDEDSVVFDENYYVEGETSKYITIHDLNPNTTYAGNVHHTSYNSDGEVVDDKWLGKKTFTTKNGPPANFYWKGKVASGEKFKNITYEEWKTFTATLLDEIEYTGNEPYYSLSEIRDSNHHLTADIWNRIMEMFNKQLYMAVYTVKTGQEVYAYMMEDIEEWLNACIDVYGPDQFYVGPDEK